MIQSHRPKLLDLVAVLKCPPDADVEVSDAGTAVELLPLVGLRSSFWIAMAAPAASPHYLSRVCSRLTANVRLLVEDYGTFILLVRVYRNSSSGSADCTAESYGWWRFWL
jgi:hypothetical protein